MRSHSPDATRYSSRTSQTADADSEHAPSESIEYFNDNSRRTDAPHEPTATRSEKRCTEADEKPDSSHGQILGPDSLACRGSRGDDSSAPMMSSHLYADDSAARWAGFRGSKAARKAPIKTRNAEIPGDAKARAREEASTKLLATPESQLEKTSDARAPCCVSTESGTTPPEQSERHAPGSCGPARDMRDKCRPVCTAAPISQQPEGVREKPQRPSSYPHDEHQTACDSCTEDIQLKYKDIEHDQKDKLLVKKPPSRSSTRAVGLLYLAPHPCSRCAATSPHSESQRRLPEDDDRGLQEMHRPEYRLSSLMGGGHMRQDYPHCIHLSVFCHRESLRVDTAGQVRLYSCRKIGALLASPRYCKRSLDFVFS